MYKFSVAACSLALCAAILSDKAIAGPTLWVNDFAGALGKVDLDTQVVTIVGNTGLVLQDIAFSPSGELFGITTTSLYRINTTNAAMSFVGNLGANLNSLVFGLDGTLYSANTQLYTINTSTGVATARGNAGSNYVSSGDLAFVGGSLLLAGRIPPFGDDSLIRLNVNTGGAFEIGRLGAGPFALASEDNVNLYGVSGLQVFRVNPSTGQTLPLFGYGAQGLSIGLGAAFATEAMPIPEPTTTIQLLAGMISLAIATRRLRRNTWSRAERIDA